MSINRNTLHTAPILVMGMVAALILTGTAMGEVTREGLVGEWHFDGDANDSSGNGNDGVIHGGATFVDGISGKALSFDGVDDYASEGNIGNFPSATISFWIYPDVVENYRNPFSAEPVWDDNIRFEESSDGAFVGSGFCDVGYYTNTTHPLIPNKWYHIVYAYNETNFYGYLNGEIKFTKNRCSPFYTDFSSLTIGGGYDLWTPSRLWDGNIDEVRIYDSALSADEIKALYDEIAGKPSNNASLIWNTSISASNHLEPVTIGKHPNATAGYDPQFDEFTQPPVMGKVILALDETLAKNIKKSVPPGQNTTWNLTIGVPDGQITALTWNRYPHPQVVLHINNSTEELQNGTVIGSGTAKLTVIAEMLDKLTFNLHLSSGWNMVSLPLVPDNSSVNAVFANISTLNVRPVVTWQNPLFVDASSIEPNKGYGVFTPASIDIAVTGMPISERNMTLAKGWNMIGTVGMDKLNLTVIPNQAAPRPPVTWQNPVFVPVTELEAGKAAWVFVTQETDVVR